MPENVKLTVSYAPFWHNGSKISIKSGNILLAALLPVAFGIWQYGIPALGAVTLAIGSAVFWELALNVIMRRPVSIGDGNAAVIGMVFAMLLPAVTPWWIVVFGTLVAVLIGKQIFGGIGGNPFNPPVIAFAILMISWPAYFDFNAALVNYEFSFNPVYPLVLAKSFGSGAVESFSVKDLLLGHQVGGIGSTFSLGLIIAGAYLILRGYIRWEISLSFLVGVAVTAFLFHRADPVAYAGAGFHLLTGFTLVGAFFLATEDSSSPVNLIPMMIYGALGGVLAVLIRNIGAHTEGVIYAILIINLVNPLIDKIRPKATGKVLSHA